ncbi:LamG domain-containing protein [Streptomyces aidingensis]|nr:LamG domain-containing protein [Streptomyces aidingensis]
MTSGRQGRSGRGHRGAALLGALTMLLATALTGPAGLGLTEDAAAASPKAAPAAPAAPTASAVTRAIASGTAATEAVARAAAETGGEPVEVTGLRQERRDVFANPDGSFTAHEYTQPVRAWKDGAWAGIDTSLTDAADGTLAPRATTVGLAFSAGGDGPFATLRTAGREYALSWPEPLPAPQVDGDTATYPDVLDGVDLVVRAETEGFSYFFVVKTAEAAQNPALDGLTVEVATTGIEVAVTDGGGLRGTDAETGGTVFESAPAMMWDSSGGPAPAAGPGTAGTAARDLAAAPGAASGPALDLADAGAGAPVALTAGDTTLTVAPDRALLRGADTVYPVVIDPSPRTTSRNAWTSVLSGRPSYAEWKYSGSAGVGKCPSNYNPTSCANVGVRRLLYTFPMSFYQGKQILSAQFSARVAHVYWADASAEPIDLYRIGGQNYRVTSGSNWGNTSDDWDDYLATVDRNISPTSCSSSANLHFTDGELLTEVKTVASGGWSYLSLGLKAKDESTYPGWKRVCGNTYLKITYNTPPAQVDYRLMSTNPGGRCTWGTDRPYTDRLPQLRAEARDPDHNSSGTDQVKMRFRVAWTKADGTEGSYNYDTGYKSPNKGTVFTHTVRSVVPENTVIRWAARAYDGDSWGPWSYEGQPAGCQFIWDSTRPQAPEVRSDEYPADDNWRAGVGIQGTFTFQAADSDVTEYGYGFDGAPLTRIPAGAGGGPATRTWTPQEPGRHWVTVVAYDAAGHASVPAQYEFLVTNGVEPIAQWHLADPAGAEAAHDTTGRYPLTPGPGAVFGVPGPGDADSAVRLDGTDAAYLDAGDTVINTDAGFTVSAWARPGTLDRDMTVLSQDSTGEPGLVLGFDAGAQAWFLSTPDQDVQAMTDWTATADGVPVTAGTWALLTAVYDPDAPGGPELRLYVDGTLAATADRPTAFPSRQGFQLGRTLAKSGYRDHFAGDLADVRVFDRALPAARIGEIEDNVPQRLAYWPLDEAPDGQAANVHSGGQPLTLHGAAGIYRPADPLFDESALVGDGHLVLDGTAAWADTASPVVTGAGSYTVAARVQLATLDSPESQTVLSLPGAHADRLVVRYQAATGQWEMAVADSDSASATVRTLTDDQALPSNDGSGQHLAVVFDALTQQVRLYIDGQLSLSADGYDYATWPSVGGLQVGRSAQGGGGEYLAGVLDEVRVYAGAVDATGIARMNQLVGDPEL